MIILFDFSNLAYSCFFSSIREQKIEPEDCPVDYRKHIQTFAKRIDELLTFFGRYDKIIFAIDKTPKNKFKIFADYKKGRKRFDVKPKEALMETIECWNSNAIYAEDHEADDAMAAYIASKEDHQKVIVVTTDKDLWQLKEFPHTYIYNFHKNRFIDETDLMESYKLESYRHIKLHKALWGDSSDNVPNAVPRMQKQLMPLIRASDGTLEHFFELVDSGGYKLTKRCLELLEANRKQIGINYELVRLNYDCPVVEVQLEYAPQAEKSEEPFPLSLDEIPF